MKFALFAILIYVFANTLQASTVLYRYKDANGGVVLGITVPPEFAKNGYEILNSKGRVIQVIEPALTDEQIADRNKREMLEAKRKKQLIADEALLKRYSHPDDAVRAEMRKLQDLQAVIKLKNGKILSQQHKLKEAESEAADKERAGQAVPEHLLKEVNQSLAEIAMIEQEIRTHKSEIQSVKIEYQSIIDRLKRITKKEVSLIIPDEILNAD